MGALVLGLADAEVNHRLAPFAQEAGLFVQFERGRFGDRSCELTEGHIGWVLPCGAHRDCQL